MEEALLDDDFCGIRVVHKSRVAQAREAEPPEEELAQIAQIYKALGDPTRLKILMALGNVEMCVCDLAAYLCMSESAVSHQLRRLRDLRLVKNRREGQILYYALADSHVRKLLDTSAKHVLE